jgi:branched-chain amino acid transport system substrate-binding protein
VAEELVSRDGVVLLTGGFLSHVGLAVSDFAKQRKVLFVAAEPLTDKLVWGNGNRYTFRLRASTYMQTSMLVEDAVKLGRRRWALIYPNYEYGQSAVASFKELMTARQPGVEFVSEQAAPLGKIEAGAVAQAIADAKPDAVFNVTFGPDLQKLVREIGTRGLLKDTPVFSLLGGEPEYLDPLKDEAPVGWYVTGYPWSEIETAAHKAFREAYRARWNDYPRLGSVVGYAALYSVAEVLRKAGSTDTEKLIAAMKGLEHMTPFGKITYRPTDHQSTMGAFVGRIGVKDGRGVMTDWRYEAGDKHLPSEDAAKKLRPAE